MIHVMVGLIFGWLITRLMLALSQRLRLVAIPNERSFHEQPTPSGGGVGLVLPVVVWAALSFQAGGLAVAVSFAGIAIACVYVCTLAPQRWRCGACRSTLYP
jgi:Fuc2NAc and GlcNAc transferase